VSRLETELRDHVASWRLRPLVAALQALRGVQDTVAITTVAELGDLTRFDTPRQLASFVGLIPSAPARGPSRRQGSITKAGNGHARRVLSDGAWAYRHPANVAEALQQRPGRLPTSIQDLAWKAQGRLCTRARRLGARGKHPPVAVTAVARDRAAFMGAIARQVRLAASWVTTHDQSERGYGMAWGATPGWRTPRPRSAAATADPRASTEAGARRTQARWDPPHGYQHDHPSQWPAPPLAVPLCR
jgi:hypothetical protein